MRKQEIALWAMEACQRVHRGVRNEDSRIEFKTTWPEAKKAARRVGGHANSMRGEPILWIIGIDETSGVVGLTESRDPGDWYAMMRSVFDGVAPELGGAVNFDFDGKVLCALQFETDAAPYVVKNQAGEGGVQFEVPWREGTLLRSAKQHELLRLLLPLQSLPSFEVLSATVVARGSGETTVEWSAELEVFVEPPQGRVVTVPFHRMEVIVHPNAGDGSQVTLTLDKRMVALGEYTLLDTMRIWATSSEAVIGCPGRIRLTARGFDPRSINDPDPTRTQRLIVHVLPSHAEVPRVFDVVLLPAAHRDGARFGRWVFPEFRVEEVPPDLTPRMNLPAPFKEPTML